MYKWKKRIKNYWLKNNNRINEKWINEWKMI